MIAAPPADPPDETMEITVDPSAETKREEIRRYELGNGRPDVNPGEVVDAVDLRTSSFVETRDGIDIKLSDGTIEARLSLGDNGSLCAEVPSLGSACYKNTLAVIKGFEYGNAKAVTIIAQPVLGKVKSVPVTLAKAKKLINDLKADGNRLPNAIKIDSYTFEKVK